MSSVFFGVPEKIGNAEIFFIQQLRDKNVAACRDAAALCDDLALAAADRGDDAVGVDGADRVIAAAPCELRGGERIRRIDVCVQVDGRPVSALGELGDGITKEGDGHAGDRNRGLR